MQTELSIVDSSSALVFKLDKDGKLYGGLNFDLKPSVEYEYVLRYTTACYDIKAAPEDCVKKCEDDVVELVVDGGQRKIIEKKKGQRRNNYLKHRVSNFPSLFHESPGTTKTATTAQKTTVSKRIFHPPSVTELIPSDRPVCDEIRKSVWTVVCNNNEKPKEYAVLSLWFGTPIEEVDPVTVNMLSQLQIEKFHAGICPLCGTDYLTVCGLNSSPVSPKLVRKCVNLLCNKTVDMSQSAQVNPNVPPPLAYSSQSFSCTCCSADILDFASRMVDSSKCKHVCLWCVGLHTDQYDPAKTKNCKWSPHVVKQKSTLAIETAGDANKEVDVNATAIRVNDTDNSDNVITGFSPFFSIFLLKKHQKIPS
jgi:hypothetical protein